MFAVNKPSGPTSARVVSKIKHLLNDSELVQKSRTNLPPGRNPKSRKNQLKVGHGGTLDPLAEGVMIIGVGAGTKKLTHYLTGCSKVYEAEAVFGLSTDSFDSTGKAVSYAPTSHLTVSAVKEAIAKHFTGEISQVPPVYSALKFNGMPLYDYARQGKTLPSPIKAREAFVQSFEVLDDEFKSWDRTEHGLEFVDAEAHALIQKSYSSTPPVEPNTTNPPAGFPSIRMRMHVGSGTYVRSLIHDLGAALGSAAYMTKLKRVGQGPFSLIETDESHLPVMEIDELVSTNEQEWVPKIQKIMLKERQLSK